MSNAVAFDLDDTLAVTGQPRDALLEQAAERADVPLTFDRDDYLDAHREHSGTASRRPVFEALVPEDAGAITKAYREAIGDAMEPAAGAAEMLDSLQHRYQLGLLTDGPEDTQRDKLDRLGWTETFDAVVITGPLDAPKPDPSAFMTLCKALGTEPSDTVYIGDDPHRDIEGARTAGLAAIQVVYGDGPSPHPAATAAVPRTELATLPRVLEDLISNGTKHP